LDEIMEEPEPGELVEEPAADAEATPSAEAAPAEAAAAVPAATFYFDWTAGTPLSKALSSRHPARVTEVRREQPTSQKAAENFYKTAKW
jgi:hypothetical protein